MKLVPAYELFSNELADWDNLPLAQQKDLRERYISYDVRTSLLVGVLGAGIGAFAHLAAQSYTQSKALASVSRFFSNYTLGVSALIGGVGTYYAYPYVLAFFTGVYFDQMYPMAKE
jgi:hypothetical protein